MTSSSVFSKPALILADTEDALQLFASPTSARRCKNNLVISRYRFFSTKSMARMKLGFKKRKSALIYEKGTSNIGTTVPVEDAEV
jgi:hypothetical protein